MLLKLLSRITNFFTNRARLSKLRHTPAQALTLGHIDSLELLEKVGSAIEVKTILDIGANEGTWTLLAKAIFPNAQVLAFEPLAIHMEALHQNVAHLKDVRIFQLATGNFNGPSTIYISSFSDASSMLNATPALREEFKISEIGQTQIDVVRLDDFFTANAIPEAVDLMKLDIQGYELEALKGAPSLLRATRYLIMEVSFIEYYHKQPLFEEVVAFMNDHGFKLSAFGQNLQRGKKLTQLDALFENTRQ